MRPRVGIFSIGITSKVIADELRAHNFPVDFEFQEMLLDDRTTLPKSVDGFDVFLSSGRNAQILRKKTDTPVITIKPSIYDILLACSKAVKYQEVPVVIVYGQDFSAQDLSQLSNILSTEILLETYQKTDSGIEEMVLRHRARGQRCVIGSGLVCEFATKHGMEGIYLFPRESICGSLRTAADLAVSVCQKNSQNLQLNSVMQYSKRGILFTDSRQTILLCNPIAATYLQTREEDAIGQTTGRYLPQKTVQAIQSATESANIFCKIGSSQYVIEVIPVGARTAAPNFLLYLDDVHSIQRTERYIRREVWAQKGFVAKYTFEMYHTADCQFSALLSMAKSFARSDEPIVILGETGTGKEVLAQSIHNYSQRAGRAFVAVNCAAIPENLLESELFGYSDGAFTGAKKGGKEGYFEMAHMGTIFFDEIGEMKPTLQSKLLRVIQEKQVLRVGGTQMTPFDARVIVATNRNLWDMVRTDAFRMDLYYRLNVLELEVPPLRERAADILPMFRDFLRQLSEGLYESLFPFGGELEALLRSHCWPGNVRELENLAHMLAVSWQPEEAPEQTLSLLSGILGKKRARANSTTEIFAPLTPFRQDTPKEDTRSPARTIKQCEVEQIRTALAACGGNITKAAELLGIHRITLWRKLKQVHPATGEAGL